MDDKKLIWYNNAECGLTALFVEGKRTSILDGLHGLSTNARNISSV